MPVQRQRDGRKQDKELLKLVVNILQLKSKFQTMITITEVLVSDAFALPRVTPQKQIVVMQPGK
jgi:hypothetical protein